MKAGLAKREPELLARWEDMDLYTKLREDAKGREPFVLHDGPPYANGAIHLGTALNKILKDFVVKSQQMMGKDANYVPGWDCHGLPIEWKVEESYRKSGKNKDEVPVLEFRKECRDYATEWIDVQRSGFKRLGVIGDWPNPYLTMSFEAEAQIVREFQKFVMNGGLYRGSKPVMWSTVEKTALAEAEVEYYDHQSPTIHARFPVVRGPEQLHGASIVIWTTTPWTIPGNRAVARSATISYGVYEVKGVGEGSFAKKGERLVLADTLADSVREAASIETLERLEDVDSFDGVVLSHPFAGHGYDFDVPLLVGDFVTDETGTGFVHIAPGHGSDDFELGSRHGLEVPFTVDEDGRYLDHVPLFAGLQILHTEGKKLGKDAEANGAVIRELIDKDRLLAKGRLKHSYPHSWRSKAPLIFRNTPQWFISMETNDLREKALKSIEEVRFVPEHGRNRIRSMVESRPDWVLSRQRAWGVPLTAFVHKETGELLRDEAVNARIVEAVEAEGADAWFASEPARFLGNAYDPDAYEMVMDIMDVWFDSGVTHAFVLEQRDDLRWPADLYLEGSDQHRGWFQSSLLEACGTRGRAPYNAILTHGFFVDKDGKKMSKSLGNTIDPEKMAAQDGAEILRLWVASSDFTEDMRIGDTIVKTSKEAYRKIRNTLRYILSNLNGFSDQERVQEISDMPELERWVLHRLSELDVRVRAAYNDFEFRSVFGELFNFCTVDLSAFYFDIRKDMLYCDAVDDIERRSCRTVLDALFNCLTTWFAPLLSFTAEEAWLERNSGSKSSVHLQQFPTIPAAWHDEALAQRWETLRRIRRVATGALEVERAEKRIGSSLDARVTLYVTDESQAKLLSGLDLAEFFISSDAVVVPNEGPPGAFRLDEVAGVSVECGLAEGVKCARCWNVRRDVGLNPDHPRLCARCSAVVAK